MKIYMYLRLCSMAFTTPYEHITRKPVFGLPTRFDKNQAVQLQKMVKRLESLKQRCCTIQGAKTKVTT